MEVKTIKGINPEKWIKFKMLAAKNNVQMGKLFDTMIESYSNRDDLVWDRILSGEKILSDEEAEDMIKITKKLRKERGFRDVIVH